MILRLRRPSPCVKHSVRTYVARVLTSRFARGPETVRAASQLWLVKSLWNGVTPGTQGIEMSFAVQTRFAAKKRRENPSRRDAT